MHSNSNKYSSKSIGQNFDGSVATQRLMFLDALRGWAVLGVIFVHASAPFANQLPGPINNIAISGARGVQLFFIVSAFSIFYSLQKSKNSYSDFKWQGFFIRRFFRIAPMFYLAILIYGSGIAERIGFLADAQNFSLSNYLTHISFAHGLWPNHINSLVPGGWSVGVEVLFYALVPLIYRFVKSTHAAIWFLIITSSFAAVVQLVDNPLPALFTPQAWANFIFLFLPTQIPVFALGILLFYIFEQNKGTDGDLHTTEYAMPALTAGIVIAIWMTLSKYSNSILFSIPLALIMYGIMLRPLRFFVNKYWGALGKVSFSVYLLHFLCIPVVGKGLIGLFGPASTGLEATILYLLTVLITLAIVTPLANLTYMFIEQPGTALGKWVQERAGR